MSEYTDWWINLMKQEGRCAACEQDDYFNSGNADFEASMPSAWPHNTESPKCRKAKAKSAA